MSRDHKWPSRAIVATSLFVILLRGLENHRYDRYLRQSRAGYVNYLRSPLRDSVFVTRAQLRHRYTQSRANPQPRPNASLNNAPQSSREYNSSSNPSPIENTAPPQIRRFSKWPTKAVSSKVLASNHLFPGSKSLGTNPGENRDISVNSNSNIPPGSVTSREEVLQVGMNELEISSGRADGASVLESDTMPTGEDTMELGLEKEERQLEVDINSLSGAPIADSTATSDLLEEETIVHDTNKSEPPMIEVTIATTREQVERAVKALYAHPDKIHACDTEVADIDLKKVGPVGNGRVICISIYSGPEVDYGDGKGKALWLDNADGQLQLLKGWFEDPRYKKVWHNYGFDRHVLYNEGIDARGFAGDTMHMARLWDTSREKRLSARLTSSMSSSTNGSDGTPTPASPTFGKGYSLESLTEDLVGRRKVPMLEIFGKPRLKKDGTPGKILDLPPVWELQTDPKHRTKWIQYSAYDAEGTWLLQQELTSKLKKMHWLRGETMMEFYQRYLVPFGELLTDMERNGIYVEIAFLRRAEEIARVAIREAEEAFHHWAESQIGPVGRQINPASGPQIQTLMFGGSYNKKLKEMNPSWREFKVPIDPATQPEPLPEEQLDDESLVERMSSEEIRLELRRRSLKVSGKKEDVKNRLLEAMNNATAEIQGIEQELRKILAERDKSPKWTKLNITGLGVPATQTTAKGLPAVDAAALQELAGNGDDGWTNGRLYSFFGGGEEGLNACKAIGALRSVGTVGAMITNFLVPLQALADEESRVHCSLNLNTETGRLSSRRPNLQNQPALEKDQYKIREAFRAEEGNTLIVADYGQLELRILAHITGCQSMIEAFASGVDFHSATAVDMFPHVRQAVETGEVLLEWRGEGKPPKPLVKDKYGAERRKAKTLNFSIVYGKTVQGLSKDWDVTIEEAEELLRKWYSARPEVYNWQQETIHNARRTGYCRTLMGRYRALPELRHRSKWVRAHGERAAINSPVQGGAADVVMMAMIKLHKSPVLRYLGYRLLLQVHDEVIIEGPEDHAEAALREVLACMTAPFDGFGLEPLRVALDVDAKYAKSWYQAK